MGGGSHLVVGGGGQVVGVGQSRDWEIEIM